MRNRGIIDSVVRGLRFPAALAVAAIALSAPAAGQRQSLAMLDQLESGRWELRSRDARAPAEQICMRDGRRLIQLRHPVGACERLIVSDGPGEVIVQYTCRGRGFGRTHIRRETGRLVQIESQGILDGLPFDVVAEARRIGDCAGA
jgi:hypothetical protein